MCADGVGAARADLETGASYCASVRPRGKGPKAQPTAPHSNVFIQMNSGSSAHLSYHSEAADNAPSPVGCEEATSKGVFEDFFFNDLGRKFS